MNDRIHSDAVVYGKLMEFLDADRDAVVATVVDVDGRSYRRPGAKLVATPDGEFGAVTTECLENEIRELAATVLDTNEPRIVTYDLTQDDDIWGLGVGCKGIVDVFIEPLDERFRPVLESREGSAQRTVATVLESTDERLSAGDRTILETGSALPQAVVRDVQRGDAENTHVVECTTESGHVSIFLDRVEPPPHLLLIGSGNDVHPIVELAAPLDVEVTVVAFRGASAYEDQFPGADHVVSTSPRSLQDDVKIDEQTYAVVMTHNIVDDRLALEALLESAAPYVGVMGPAERFQDIRHGLEDDGIRLSDDDLARVYAPIGLNLGGGDPLEIAHSVIAEVLATANGRDGGHLRDVPGPIHERVTPRDT